MFVRQRAEKGTNEVTEKARIRARLYYLANREKILLDRKARYAKNPAYNVNYQKYIVNTSFEKRLEMAIRVRFCGLGIKPCKENLGCSFDDFFEYIKSQMTSEMNEQNYGRKKNQWGLFLDSTDDFSYYNWKPLFRTEMISKRKERRR